jgi:hypothetical protein
LAPAGRGGKPRSTGPRHCTRRRAVASRLAGRSGVAPVRPRPSARPHEAERPGGSRLRAAAPAGRGRDRPAEATVARSEWPGAIRREAGVAASRGSIPPPKSGARGGVPTRLARGSPRASVWPCRNRRRKGPGGLEARTGSG